MALKPEQIPSGEETTAFIPAASQRYRQDLSRLAPPSSEEPLFMVRAYNLAAGQSVTIYCDAGIPDKWLITILAGAGIRVNIYDGPQPSGDPIICSGGANIKIPGLSEYVTLSCTGGTAIGNVIAWRNPRMTVDVSAGGTA